MARENLNDLLAFVSVAREHSFTKAASKLGVSPSALSHALRALETRLGVRLLNRTTRSVSATQAGERLLLSLGPRFDEIETELDALSEFRDKPAGTIRITSGDHAANTILWPRLARFLPRYPDIHVEIVVEYALTDIVAQRYDAGVRMGEQVASGMIGVPIGPPMSMAAVGAPSYFSKRPIPKHPQDLTQHNCINLRLPTHGGTYAWEFEKNRREINVRVSGQLTFNGVTQILNAALDGFGIGYLPEDLVRPLVAKNKLRRVLEDWCPAFPGYYLYYPSRRQSSSAFSLFVDALRWRG
jgi:DNA-binding transcriptional LysR family regulator